MIKLNGNWPSSQQKWVSLWMSIYPTIKLFTQNITSSIVYFSSLQEKYVLTRISDVHLQSLSNSFESYVISGNCLSVMALCASTFIYTYFIFQRLLSIGERMSPNTCSKIPRQALSRWMVPATATITSPWAEDIHFNP